MNQLQSSTAIQKMLRDTEIEIEKITGMRVLLSVNSSSVSLKKMIELQQIVCAEFGYTFQQICEFTRERTATDALHVFMYLAVMELGCSRVGVAKYCDRYDHTIAIYAIKKIQKFYSINDPICMKIDRIKNALKTKLKENENTN